MRLAISACLLGREVRYDGGHCYYQLLNDILGPLVEFVPICPEAECGLGTPREIMQLEGDPERPRLVTVVTRQDLTERMARWAQTRITALQMERLKGAIFKKGSPSCGVGRVKVYDRQGIPVCKGRGLFAQAFMAHFPSLPVVDEELLREPGRLEAFIARITQPPAVPCFFT